MRGTSQAQSYSENNGGVVCIDESLLSTLCRSNVIPVTSAATTVTRRGLRVAASIMPNGMGMMIEKREGDREISKENEREREREKERESGCCSS
jgi:hypothetical protein